MNLAAVITCSSMILPVVQHLGEIFFALHLDAMQPLNQGASPPPRRQGHKLSQVSMMPMMILVSRV